MLPVEEAGSDLELRDYLQVVRRRKWIILGVTVLVVGAALAISLVQTPVYRGSAEVLLQPRSNESLFNPQTGQRADPERAVQTEIQLIESRPVRDRVRDELGSAPEVSASPVGQTDVIRVSAESTDADEAADVANAYANAYISFRREQAVEDVLAAGDEVSKKVADIQSQINALDARIAEAPAPGRAALAASLQGERDNLLRQQALFQDRLDQLQVDAALKSGGAQLVTPAVVADSPVRPTPVRNASVALVVGLILGVGVAFLREYLDDSLKGTDDIERAAPAVPILALVPAVADWKDRRVPVVASLDHPESPVAEAYRSLRTSVQFLGLDRPLRLLQVTSSSAAEGKTTTVANLAVAMARAGRRVVVVDADLRRPRLHAFFGLDHDRGLTSVLLREAPLSEVLQPVAGVESLAVVASGPVPPNPSELLGSPRAAEVFSTLATNADIVLVDSPPVLPVTDASVLSAHMDGTLLVVTAGDTTRSQLRHAAETLARVSAPVLGIVFNGVRGGDTYGVPYAYRYYGYGRKSAPPTANGPQRPAAPADTPPARADRRDGMDGATPAPSRDHDGPPAAVAPEAESPPQLPRWGP